VSSDHCSNPPVLTSQILQGLSNSDLGTSTGSDLTAATVGALRWSYAGVLARSISGLVINVVLARLLGPEPFGVIAIAWLVIGLGNLLGDIGVGPALVQNRKLHDEDIRFTFGLQLAMGTLLAMAVALGASGIAGFFRQEDARPVLMAMAAIFVLQALGQTSGNLLRRSLRFRELQAAQVVSYLVGYLAVGIPSAVMGFGVWSLVAAQLIQSLLFSVLQYACVRHRLMPSRYPKSRGLLRFGGAVFGTNLANWVINYIDTAIVGRSFGIVDLGTYNRVLAFLNTPTSAGISGMQSVLFPAYSRAQGRPDALRRAYLVSIRTMAILVIPPLICVATVPRTVILGLYGPRWVGASSLAIPLALAMAVHSLMALGGPLLWGIGKASLELRVQSVVALVALTLFATASHFSLLAFAWTVLGVYVIRWLLISWAVSQIVGPVGVALLGTLLRGVSLAAAAAGAVWLTDLGLSRIGTEDAARLVAVGLAGALSMGVMFYLTRRWVTGPDLARVITESRGIPALLRRFLTGSMPEAGS
jgi:O-antigen/teichoic acid export membrane protein